MGKERLTWDRHCADAVGYTERGVTGSCRELEGDAASKEKAGSHYSSPEGVEICWAGEVLPDMRFHPDRATEMAARAQAVTGGRVLQVLHAAERLS